MKLVFVLFFLLFNLFFITVPKIFANTTQTIDFQVKLSVCGDSVIENPEDCEGLDLNGQSCDSIGYLSGDLSCTSSCDFDTSLCIPLPTPTPTPTPEPTPEPTVEPGSSVTNTGSSGQTTSTANSSSASTTSTTQNVIEQITQLFTQTGQLTKTDFFPEKIRTLLLAARGNDQNFPPEVLPVVLEQFAVYWRTSLVSPTPTYDSDCDINLDNTCDIVDLSVLLYYVGRNN